jgi:group I intron endonuclease
MHFIYKITNAINGKCYIGQTRQPQKRWYQHKHDAANPRMPIHHAIRKYGNEAFEFKVIDFAFNQWEANCLESGYIERYDSRNNLKGYNIEKGGYGGTMSPETREKISNSLLGNTRTLGRKCTEEQKRVISQNLRGNQYTLGRLATDERKAHLSKIRSGEGNAMFGKKHSEETKRKMSEGMKRAHQKKL